MNTQTVITIRIDKKTKEEAGKIFKKLGLTFSSGIKLFLNQVIKTKSLPFEITMNDLKSIK